MHLYLPRRRRRPLLFPPGLLALAGLLWLGCVAMNRNSEKLKSKGVIQLTMVPLHPSPNIPELHDHPLLLSPDKLNKFRHWQDASFSGSSQEDAREQIRLSCIIHDMATNIGENGGVRIQFAPTAHYQSLVFILDLLNRENVKRYWLHTRQKCTTLYMFTKAYEPRSAGRPGETTEYYGGRIHHGTMVGCFFYDDAIYGYAVPTMPPSIPFWHLTWLRPLLQPKWRVSAWFLAAIVALGGWRILRPRRATQAP